VRLVPVSASQTPAPWPLGVKTRRPSLETDASPIPNPKPLGCRPPSQTTEYFVRVIPVGTNPGIVTMFLPLSASDTRAVLSWLAVSIRRPIFVCGNDAPVARITCAVHYSSVTFDTEKLIAISHSADSNGPIFACSDDVLSVRRKGNCVHPLCVTCQGCQRPTRIYLPYVCSSLKSPGRYELTVRRKNRNRSIGFWQVHKGRPNAWIRAFFASGVA
jgi:hypothetical protein